MGELVSLGGFSVGALAADGGFQQYFKKGGEGVWCRGNTVPN